MNLILLLVLSSALQAVCIHGSCTVGREWTPNNENPDPGTYIDLSNIAQCSGLISQFHFCSLNANSYNDLGSNITVGLHVWRFDTGFVNGVLVREYNATSSPVDVGFQCKSVDVQSEAIEIAQGDVLGVRMFQTRVPLVGNFDPVFAPAILSIMPDQFSTTINRRNLPDEALFSGNVIFLRADVVPVPVPTTTEAIPETTTPITTPSTSTSADTTTLPTSTETSTATSTIVTTENSTPVENQTRCIVEVGNPFVPTTSTEMLDYRIVVGVGCVAILQMVMIILIVVVAIILGRRQKEKLRRRTISTKAVLEDNSDEMVSNKMYGLRNSMTRRDSEDNATDNDLHYSNLFPRRSDAHINNENSESFSMHVNVVYPPSLPKIQDHSYDYISR